MQIYETVVVVKPKFSDEEVADLLDKTKKFIVKSGGEIVGEDKWGRRKLAYPIGQAREGYYLYLKFSGQGSVVTKLNQHFRIQDTLLRTMTVQFQEHKEKEKKAKKPKAAASAAAPAPAPKPQ